MRKTPKLTVTRLKELLSYDAATGIFTCIKTRKGVAVGDIAGFVHDSGYRRLWLDGEEHAASSLAWFYVHGEWPSRNLWFKDENRDNTAIENLSYGETDSKDLTSMNAYQRKYRKRYPDKAHAKRIKNNYGVTLDQYREMLLAQNGCCAICKKPETAAQNGRIVPLSVDHDHITGEIRGLLCRRHNAMLGQGNDSEEIMLAAVEYLRAHAAKPKSNVVALAGRRIVGAKGE